VRKAVGTVVKQKGRSGEQAGATKEERCAQHTGSQKKTTTHGEGEEGTEKGLLEEKVGLGEPGKDKYGR